MPIADVCVPVHQTVYYSYKNWPRDFGEEKVLRGSKCPSYIYNMKEVSTYLPKTKAIMGIRHPVLWFQSFWNMLVSNDPSMQLLSPYNKTAPCLSRKGCLHGCPNGQLFCVGRAEFHVSFAELGKTALTQEERALLAPDRFYGGEALVSLDVQNPIFIYEQTQLKENDVWDEMAQFLRLPEIQHDKLHLSRGGVSLSGKQKAIIGDVEKSRINICDAEYDDLRKIIMPVAHNVSVWFSEHFIPVARDVSREDVTVAGVDKFFKLVQDYTNDPCGRLVRKDDGNYELKPEYQTAKDADKAVATSNKDNGNSVKGYDESSPKGKKYDDGVMSGSSIKDFEHQDGVVITTKIHGHFQWPHLKQSLCLLKYAYNARVNYDILVFSTIAVDESEIQEMRELVAPAKFSVVVDNPGLGEFITSLDEESQQKLYHKCNVSTLEEFEWDTKCHDERVDQSVKMSYLWQAEFRSLHIWQQPALKPYRYMVWVDADAFATKRWEQDPVAFFIQNELALMFANFPAGASRGLGFQERFEKAFNRKVCKVTMHEGHLVKEGGTCHQGVRIKLVHGFFHITDLNLMRSDPAMKWFRAMIGKDHFSRSYDDQLAVTMAGVMLAPNRSVDMEYYGMFPDMWHNGYYMGKMHSPETTRFSGNWAYTKWLEINGQERFPEVIDKCPIKVAQ